MGNIIKINLVVPKYKFNIIINISILKLVDYKFLDLSFYLFLYDYFKALFF